MQFLCYDNSSNNIIEGAGGWGRQADMYFQQGSAGCFGFNGPLRQFFSIYIGSSHREKRNDRRERKKYEKKAKTRPATRASQKGLVLVLS